MNVAQNSDRPGYAPRSRGYRVKFSARRARARMHPRGILSELASLRDQLQTDREINERRARIRFARSRIAAEAAHALNPLTRLSPRTRPYVATIQRQLSGLSLPPMSPLPHAARYSVVEAKREVSRGARREDCRAPTDAAERCVRMRARLLPTLGIA